MNQKGISLLAVILIITALVSGTIALVYLPKSQKYLSNQSAPSPQASPASTTPIATDEAQVHGLNQEDKTETVVIQDNYSFSVLVPKGYTLLPKGGSYIAYIGKSLEKPLVGFAIYTLGGEKPPKKIAVNIDDVQFDTYSQKITCDASFEPSKQVIKPETFTQAMEFGILTWCQDENLSDDFYAKIITSLKFSPELKKVLSGEVEAPILKQ